MVLQTLTLKKAQDLVINGPVDLDYTFLYLNDACLALSLILIYVGHPISSDNELISQRFKSELFCQLNVVMDVAYSFLK